MLSEFYWHHVLSKWGATLRGSMVTGTISKQKSLAMRQGVKTEESWLCPEEPGFPERLL